MDQDIRNQQARPDQPPAQPGRCSRRFWLRSAGLLLLSTAGSGVLAACGASATLGAAPGTTAASISAATQAAKATATGPASTSAAVATAVTTTSRASAAAGTATASVAPTAAPNAHAGNPTVIYSCWGDPVQQQSDQACLKAFEEKYSNAGFTMKLEDAPWDGFHQHLQVQAAGGTDPDVMLISSAFFPNFARLGMFLDLMPYVTQAKLDRNNLPPGTLNFLTIGTKLFGMPTGGFSGGGANIACAQPMFEAAGVPNPSEDWTWDDMVHVAQKLTSGSPNDPNAHFGVDFAKTSWEGLWETMLWTYGGNIWNKERTESIIDSEAAKTIFQYFKDLADRWNVSGPDPDQKQLYAGKIGMTSGWARSVTTLINKATFPLYTVLTPTGPQGHGIQPPTGQSHAYTIAATSKHPEDAWQFLQFLLTDPAAERARGLASVAGVSWKPNIPIFASKLPGNQKQWWSVQEYYIDHMPPFEALTPEITSRVLPTYDEQMKIITEQLNRFYGGQTAVSAAVSEMKRLLDAALKQAQATAAK